MNTGNSTGASAGQVASIEASAAEAAVDINMEVDDHVGGTSFDPNEELIDYNEEDPIPVLNKNKNGKEAVSSEDKEIKIKALRDKLAENGYALRAVLMNEHITTHYVSPMSTEQEMTTESILSEMTEDDLKGVAIVQGRIFMPVNFVQKWILPTLRVRKALDAVKDGTLPGGIETALLYSIFDQSIIDFGRQDHEVNATGAAIRAVMAYASDDTTVDMIPRMKLGNNGIAKSAVASLRELEAVCQLPKAKELWNMHDREIDARKDSIAEAIGIFCDHVGQNNNDQQLLREQTTLLASLAFEQQKHICDLNDRYFRLLEEKNQLVQRDDQNIHNDVDTIINTMKTLQETLTQRHEEVSKIIEPIDMSKIMSTMTKLKIALYEISTRNAQLVMRNDKLRLQLSFMPPQMWDKIIAVKDSRSPRYDDQRMHPSPVPPTPF